MDGEDFEQIELLTLLVGILSDKITLSNSLVVYLKK